MWDQDSWLSSGRSFPMLYFARQSSFSFHFLCPKFKLILPQPMHTCTTAIAQFHFKDYSIVKRLIGTLNLNLKLLKGYNTSPSWYQFLTSAIKTPGTLVLFDSLHPRLQSLKTKILWETKLLSPLCYMR